jgi:hypothetical protein
MVIKVSQGGMDEWERCPYGLGILGARPEASVCNGEDRDGLPRDPGRTGVETRRYSFRRFFQTIPSRSVMEQAEGIRNVFIDYR